VRGRSDRAPLSADYARDYLSALKHQRRLAPATLANYERAMDLLVKLNQGRALQSLEASDIRRGVAMLHAKGLAPRTLALVLSAWRGWFRWLARHKGFKANPALGIRAPKAPRPLPKALSVEATQTLLEGESKGPMGLRDRAMFELLYSSGLRLAELVALDAGDGRLDLREGEVTVTGKGAKTRTVPVGA
jgi:integrase/recombinase XerC